MERDQSLPRERNPSSKAQKGSPLPKGEKAFHASLMAESIVTKRRRLCPSLKCSSVSRCLEPHGRQLGDVSSAIAWVEGSQTGRPDWFYGLGAFLTMVLAYPFWTPVEGEPELYRENERKRPSRSWLCVA
jgi:hypothetical protein